MPSRRSWPRRRKVMRLSGLPIRRARPRRYTCEINRDTGWNALGAAGFETVRMVAIDEDWTAKRLRRAEFIKAMKRDASYAMSKAGKEKAGKPKR